VTGLALAIKSIFLSQVFQTFWINQYIHYTIFNGKRSSNGQNDCFPSVIQYDAIWRLSIRAIELSINKVRILKPCVCQQSRSVNMATVVSDDSPIINRTAIVAVVFVVILCVFVV